MNLNLLLSAQALTLSRQLQKSALSRGLMVVKNVPAKTYLRVTPEEWRVLLQFETPKTVPEVLGDAIRDRYCLPLGEFYEMVVKALRANVLVVEGMSTKHVDAHEWEWSGRPEVLGKPLFVLLVVGVAMAVWFPPKLPASAIGWVAGLAILSATLSFANFLAASLVNGAGGEIYRPRWRWLAFPPCFTADLSDAVMLSEPELRVINMVAPAALATAAGIAAWNRPGWAFLPLLGLAFSLRPIFGGSVVPLLRVGKERGPSDAEHNFIFPPNRRPRERIRLLTRALAEPTTWARIAYGIAWTMAILCWGVRLGGTPPWTLSFWQNNGLRLAVAVGGSLLLVLAAYLARETFMAARDDARARRRAIALWRRRWFRGKNLALDEPYRLKLMAATQIFSGFLPFEREEIARTMVPERCGPWRALNAKGAIPAKVSLIVSGKVGLRRETASGRTVAVQVLTEGDVVGLSDLADPGGPRYQARTLTPVTLLTLQRADAERLISQKIPPTTLADFLLKAPFLRQIPLCRNWHLQAVNRFSRLSVIRSFPPGDTIMSEGQTVEDFFIIFQGDAKVSQRERKVSTIRAGEFFGEIGLMQNSCPIASVTAHLGTRCLSIPRKELLRFVTHNYTVALELEHVSSKRLGRPLFPLRAGDFRGI